jgi:hypothetical protein
MFSLYKTTLSLVTLVINFSLFLYISFFFLAKSFLLTLFLFIGCVCFFCFELLTIFSILVFSLIISVLLTSTIFAIPSPTSARIPTRDTQTCVWMSSREGRA